MENSPNRIQVVDALRGFAIISIMLLHNIEHFDFYYTPENLPEWMVAVDKIIWYTLFFLFAGKSYAIFALLFGLTFFIQSNNQARKGKDFRLRFAWRLVLLLLFGIINSAFYQGDILMTYAIIGFVLIPVAHLNSKTVLIIAIILLLQPFEWFNFIYALQHPQLVATDPASWAYFGKMESYITGKSLLNTMVGNLTNGKTAVFMWTWEAGRVLQTAALFMLGMLAGRVQLFNLTPETIKIWQKILLTAIISAIPLFIFSLYTDQLITNKLAARSLNVIIGSLANLSFMMIWVSGIVLLFRNITVKHILSKLSPIGRMSMSNYIIQSVLGAFIYYGFGLSMYKYTGATYAVIIGIILALIQSWFSAYYLKKHNHGPFESIWHKLTWLGYK